MTNPAARKWSGKSTNPTAREDNTRSSGRTFFEAVRAVDHSLDDGTTTLGSDGDDTGEETEFEGNGDVQVSVGFFRDERLAGLELQGKLILVSPNAFGLHR